MPDDGRLNSKPENLGRHAFCPECITRLLPEWCPWTPLKEDATRTTTSQAMGFYVRHSASSVWQSAGYSR